MSLANGKGIPNASITIRIPAARFNEALERIRSESDQIPQNQNINSQDITSEYTDLESRLRNLQAAEAQLTEIMGSATKTEDVLSVYNQLVSVREQIEVIKGQMKYYEQSVALSSISTELVANEAVQPITVGGWQPGGAVRRAIQTLVNTLQGLVTMVIWLVVYLLPVLLALFIIFGLPLILIIWGVRTWRRRRQARKTAAIEKTQV
jgi:Flp pilus assembly protein TadB